MANEILNEENCEVETFTCTECSGEHSLEEVEEIEHDGSSYCQSCYDENFSPCYECGDVTDVDEMHTHDDNLYCDDCYSDRFSCCDRCSSTTERDGMTEVHINSRRGSEYWCDTCVNRYASRCSDCSDTWHDDYTREVYGTGRVCDGCFENGDYISCNNCGDYMHTHDSFYSEESESDYCQSCFDSLTPKLINSYSYKPAAIFKGKGDTYFGIELEVERDGSDTSKGDMATEIKDDDWYFKQDGSLNDGFEIITHPMSFDYIVSRQDDLKSMLSKLSSSGYKSYDKKTCGMHIHISKKGFGTWHLLRFMKFFQDNPTFVTAISQRTKDQLDKWASIEDESEDELIYKAKKKSGNSKRYVAINLQNSFTVELRLFRGTLNPSSFFKNIEFTQALFNFSKDEKDMTVDNFKKYISKSNEYSMLKKFLKLKNL